MVVFEISDNLVDILHVEVYEKLRRQGIGTELIRMLLNCFSSTEMPFIVQAVYSMLFT